jgi:hypothetical protein
MPVTFNLSKTNDLGAAVAFAFTFAIGWLTEIVNGAAAFDSHTLAVPALAGLTLAGAVIGYTGASTTA